MVIVGLDFSTILSYALKESDYYRYDFGTNIKVTTLSKINNNKLLASTLSFKSREDKLMTEYYPNCRIYFDKELVDCGGTLAEKLVSSLIDTDTGSVYVGEYDKYPTKDGVLLISGNVESLAFENNAIVINRDIDIFSKASVLAVGSVNGVLYGATLLSTDNSIGFHIGNSSLVIGTAPKPLEVTPYYREYHLTDWFKYCRVSETD